MFDFTPVINKHGALSELTADLTRDDLRRFTNEMIDKMLGLIANCTDFDVTFTPVDPQANDTFASTEAEVNLPWTLGHVIVHATASAEEAAFLAAELARGVELHGRSRAEVPWTSIKTIAQCRERLAESRRMRLATLDVWPDRPHLENTYTSPRTGEAINATTRFMLGLQHDQSHLDQIAGIVRQSHTARN